MYRPIPRLYHVKPGQEIHLSGDGLKKKPVVRVLLSKDDRYAYFEDGLKVSLCHPVNPEFMVFGDGAGWRVKP